MKSGSQTKPASLAQKKPSRDRRSLPLRLVRPSHSEKYPQGLAFAQQI